MNKLLLIAFGILPAISNAEYYKVTVKRIDENLYKTQEGLYIETKYCFEYASGEDAILKYDQYSYENKLIFDNGTSCAVSKVFR